MPKMVARRHVAALSIVVELVGGAVLAMAATGRPVVPAPLTALAAAGDVAAGKDR
jgi:hypothetical protein